jgi:Uma2 family endonuclease
MDLQPKAGGIVMAPMSRAEFEALPDLPHAEWWDGCCVVTGNVYEHGRAVANLTALPDAEFVPDLVVVREPVDAKAKLRAAPILGIEILSPSTRHIDLGLKRARYAEAGLAWYWIADLERGELIVLRNDDGRFIDVERVREGTTTAPFEVSLNVSAL